MFLVTYGGTLSYLRVTWCQWYCRHGTGWLQITVWSEGQDIFLIQTGGNPWYSQLLKALVTITVMNSQSEEERKHPTSPSNAAHNCCTIPRLPLKTNPNNHVTGSLQSENFDSEFLRLKLCFAPVFPVYTLWYYLSLLQDVKLNPRSLESKDTKKLVWLRMAVTT